MEETGEVLRFWREEDNPPDKICFPREGEVVFIREDEATWKVTVIKIGSPEYTKTHMTMEEAKAYREEIK